MANAGAIRAGKAFVELYADDSKLAAGLRRAQKRLQSFGASVRTAGLALFGVGTAAVTALAGTAKLFADMGDAVNKASQRTGIAVETLSELGYAAEQSGLEMSTLEGGLRRMAAVVVEAAHGSKGAQQALAALGLSASELGRLSPDEQFKAIADRMARIENPTVRAAVAMDIFGKSGTQLLPMLREGRAGIEALQQRARDLGLAHLPEIAEREAAPLGLTVPQCLGYLRDNLHFTFTAREQRGLELFYQLACRHGLARPGLKLDSRQYEPV